MRLQMRHLHARIRSQGLKGANLIGNHVFKIVGTHVDAPTAEAPEVVEAGMRTNTDAGALCIGNNLTHGQRITCMETAGDIGRTDDLQDPVVVANIISAEALRHVCVEVDLDGHCSLRI